MMRSPEQAPIVRDEEGGPDRADLRDQEIELQERIIDGFIEQAIAEGSRLDEGARGVVVAIKIKDIPPLLRQTWIGDQPGSSDDQDDERAAKILKVYIQAEAQREAVLQESAGNIIRGGDSSITSHIHVPHVDMAKDISIRSEQTVTHLRELGVAIPKAGDRVGVVVMEKVEGQNLRTWSYCRLLETYQEEIQRKLPDLDLAQYIEIHKHNEAELVTLIRRITGIMNDDILDVHMQERLRYKGLMDREKTHALSQALKRLHDHGFFHRDLHLKNLMIGDDGKLHLIDFDRSVQIDSDQVDQRNPAQITEDVYRKAGDRNYLRDSWIVSYLHALASGAEDSPRHNILAEPRRIIDQITRLVTQGKNAKFVAAWQELQTTLQAGNALDISVTNFLRSLNLERDENWLAGTLLLLAEAGYDQQVVDLCRDYIEKSSVPESAANKLQSVWLTLTEAES